MRIASIILETIGIVLLITGYRKSNRNILLLAAIVLWFGSSMGDMVQGFQAGYRFGSSY